MQKVQCMVSPILSSTESCLAARWRVGADPFFYLPIWRNYLPQAMQPGQEGGQSHAQLVFLKVGFHGNALVITLALARPVCSR